jgi:hypothetical protein
LVAGENDHQAGQGGFCQDFLELFIQAVLTH